MKIHEDSLKNFQAIERTGLRFGDGQSSKGNNSKSIKASVTVLALYTSSNVD